MIAPCAILVLMVCGCSPDRAAVVGQYVAKRSGGGDTLWLRPDGVYVQHAVLDGNEAWQSVKWRFVAGKQPFEGDVLLWRSLYLDPLPGRIVVPLTPMSGWKNLSLDRFWLDRSLGNGEGRPIYRRTKTVTSEAGPWPATTAPSDSQ
jgi:hypothetical protein